MGNRHSVLSERIGGAMSEGGERGTRLFRILRWYLLLVELVVVVLGIVKLTSGGDADQ